jgi:ribosome-associated translation inhibitor RaiA
MNELTNTNWHELSEQEAVQLLECDRANDLKKGEVGARLQQFGRNEMTARKRMSEWKRFLLQFAQPLMYILALSRFSDRITRVEVHLSDQNSDKSGQDDKRCMMEARIEGRQPTAVTHQAATLDDAVDGAADKLKRSIESTLERLEDAQRA